MSVVRLWVSLGVVILGFVLSACGDSGNEKVFRIAGIPDQNASTLAQKYDILTDYLSQESGLTVEYVPTVKYAATVTSFNRGDIQRAWFGGLTEFRRDSLRQARWLWRNARATPNSTPSSLRSQDLTLRPSKT